MKTPIFWQSNNVFSLILRPISALYYFFYKIRCAINTKPYKSKIPVICIGNITAGGSGKTPIAIEIANILRKKNKNFCFLSKGYGGKFKGIRKVDSGNAEIFGDEPVILSEYGDVFVSKNRVSGLKYINDTLGNRCDYIIVDDGMQNPTFHKNVSVLVVDGEYGFGNGNILPSGPLREKFENVVSRTNFVIIIGEDKHNISGLCRNSFLPFMKANIVLKNNNFSADYVAFCGIGHPDKFKKTLDDNDIKYDNFVVFGDHHFYDKRDVELLKTLGDRFLTTKKDWVKLDDDFRKSVDFLDIKVDLNSDDLSKRLSLC